MGCMRENENTKRQLNNKGFSLVELIVVIAVMAVLLSLATYGIYVMVSGDTKRASKTMSGEISSIRGNTLAILGDWQYEIVNKNGNYKLYIYKDKVEQECTDLGSRINIAYKTSESASEVKLEKGQKMVITFVQGSGKVKDIQVFTPANLEGAIAPDPANSVKGVGYCEFVITVGNGKSAESFKLYYETGKVIAG